MIVTCHWCGNPGRSGVSLVFDSGATHWFCGNHCCETWLAGSRILGIKLSEAATDIPMFSEAPAFPPDAITEFREFPQKLEETPADCSMLTKK